MPTINDLPRVSTSTDLSNVIIPIQETINGVTVTRSAVASYLFGKGYTGSNGIAGNQGYTGSQGETGPAGPAGGYTGSVGIGSVGYTGSRGLSGNNGSTGPQGPIGYTGSQGGGGPASYDIVFSIVNYNIAPGSGISRWYIFDNLTVSNVSASISNTSTMDLIFDVNKNGTTIFTNQDNRPTIPVEGFFTATNIPNITSLTTGDYLTVDIDQSDEYNVSDAAIRIRVS